MSLRLLLPMLVAATALSGCTSEPAEELGPVGRIDGAVLDHVMFPYSNASVHLIELDVRAITTDLGGFSFVNVPPGFHTLEVEIRDVGVDREIVAVDADQTTKIILQVYDTPEESPHVTGLSDHQVIDLAMPGEHCDDCTWRAQLKDGHRPSLVGLKVAWDGQHPLMAGADTNLVVEVKDQQGRLLLGPYGPRDTFIADGMHTIIATLDGAKIGDESTSLKVHITFHEDNPLPHPDFEVDSFLYLHYGDTSQLE